MQVAVRRGALVRRALVVLAGVALSIATVTSASLAGTRPVHVARASARSGPLRSPQPVDDSLRGRSGKLLAAMVAASRPSPDSSFTFIYLHPFAEKVNGWLGRYHIGFWPAEKGAPVRSEAYANPRGFIEITRANEDTRISEHFRLRDFLTHDQQGVWPKYLVLRPVLVDKLELVIADLQAHGVTVRHMTVMSGFRTPQYNATGGETGGRAELSRHMYGDAADVFVDNDGDGRMDDLNHDGRIDYHDAQVILEAVERVERAHPDVVGGVGVYRATSSHGPFAHVDVRGWRARWGLIG